MKKSTRKLLQKTKYVAKQGISVLKSKKVVPVLQPNDANVLLQNKVALITGGSGGIGSSIAKKFLTSGCKVILVGTNEKKLKELTIKFGDNCAYIIMDLNKVTSFQDKLNEAIKIFGKIDILVNSAGIHSTKMISEFLDVDEKEYDSIMNINLKGTYFLSQKVANYMIENKIKGHILNISSSVANEPAWSPYRLSKWGIKGFTKGLAEKLLPYNIIVNAIAPGSTATQLLGVNEGDSIYTDDNKIGRYVMPQEIAEFALLLVSSLGDMVVGDTIYISGGRGVIDYR